MNHELQLQIQAWVDGELPPDAARKIESLVASDRVAGELAANLRGFSRTFREAEPVRPVPESRDFYWSKIRQGIEAGQRKAMPQEPGPAHSPLRWLAWLLPAGAAALTAFFIFNPPDPSLTYTPGESLLPPPPELTDHQVETPSSEVSSLTYYAENDGMTVVWLGTVDFL